MQRIKLHPGAESGQRNQLFDQLVSFLNPDQEMFSDEDSGDATDQLEQSGKVPQDHVKLVQFVWGVDAQFGVGDVFVQTQVDLTRFSPRRILEWGQILRLLTFLQLYRIRITEYIW